MNDRNGTPLAIGDQVEWLGMDGALRVGWVRRLEPSAHDGRPVVVVDDGDRNNPELLTNNNHEARVIDAPERVVRVDDAR